MKRITSFFCAMMIVFSAMALSQRGIMRLGIEKQALEENGVVSSIKQSGVSKPDFATLKSNTRRAPKAVAAETNVTIVNVESSYKDGVLSMGMIASDRIFAFEINLPEGKEDLVSGQTYTIADMIANGCAGYNNSFSWFVMFTEVSLTKTVASNGAITIVADVTDEVKDIWHLTYEKAAPAPVEEIVNITFTSSAAMKYYTDTKDWYIVAQNDDYAVVIDILSNDSESLPAGSYETTDFDLSYTYVINIEDPNTQIHATSAAAEVSHTGDRTDIIAVLKCTDGKTYRATMFNEPLVLKDPVEVTIKNVTFTDYGTDVYYKLTNEAQDSIFYFDIYKDSSLNDVELGTIYTLDDMMEQYSYMSFNTVINDYYMAEFKKTVDSDGYARIEATVADNSGNVYHLVYQEAAIVPSGKTADIFFTEPMAIPQYYNDDESWELSSQSLSGDTAVYFVYVNHNPASPAGTYTTADLIKQYSGIILNNTLISFSSADFTVTETDERIDLVATAVGSDAVTYNIKMFFIKPKAESYETITATNLTFNTNYYSSYGAVIFAAGDQNNAISLTINVNGLNADMAGEYIAGVDYNGTITPVGGEKSDIYSGKVTITVDAENGNINISGSVLCLNLTEYTIDLTFIKPEPITYNITISSATFAYQEAYSRVDYTLNSDDNTYRFFFKIYLDEGQEDVVLGSSYNFADDMAGNQNLSYGMNRTNYSFIDYAEATFVKFQDGNKLKITATIIDIDGNTWNLAYEEIKDVDTAIDNINSNSKSTIKKHIVNGVVVIERDGHIFNTSGVKMK